MALRFVKPETVRLELGDGDWIEIKRRLTLQEQEQLTSAGLRDLKGSKGEGDVQVQMKWESFKIEKFLVWLVDWSARDENDKPIKLNRDSLAVLDPDSAQQIEEAIERHEEEIAAEKKARTGKTAPVPV